MPSLREIIVSLPWPPSALMPNAARRLPWQTRSAAAKRYRNRCWADALSQGAHLIGVPDVTLSLEVQFCPPDRRKRDLDNLLAAIKSGIDAVAAAAGIDDERFSPVSVSRGNVVVGGAVFLRIRPAGSTGRGVSARSAAAYALGSNRSTRAADGQA